MQNKKDKQKVNLFELRSTSLSDDRLDRMCDAWAVSLSCLSLSLSLSDFFSQTPYVLPE